ncbi:hypothetical protein DL96DRAFT_1818399 [Flagelloscypha sp. PMI_526]|nr:hypothetical protein DL96DRAFT_1818399 [Flagelloscypha sp. PMI_526]
MANLRLEDLPGEILFSILALCNLRDILALRQTNKQLQRLTVERTVWLDALSNVICQLQLSNAAFPLTTMSVSELECAATGWLRFKHALYKHGASPPDTQLSPFQTRIIHLEKIPRAMCITPGGQFLATVVNSTLILWDLTQPIPTCRAQISVTIPSDMYAGVDVQTVDADYLISLWSYDLDANGLSIGGTWRYILRFKAPFNACDLELLGKLESAEEYGTATLGYFEPFQCKLIMSVNRPEGLHYLLWDVRSGALSCWPSLHDQPAYMLLCSEVLIVGYSNDPRDVEVFELPILPNPQDYAPAAFATVGAHLLHPRVKAEPSRTIASIWEPSFNDYRSNPHSLRIDMIQDRGNRKFEIAHKQIRPVALDASSNTLPLSPIEFSILHERSYTNFPLSVGWFPTAYTLPDDSRLLWSKPALNSPPYGRLMYHLASVAEGSEDGGTSGLLFESSENFELMQATLCPASGRLCTVQLGGEDVDQVGVVVSDFVKPYFVVGNEGHGETNGVAMGKTAVDELKKTVKRRERWLNVLGAFWSRSKR